MTIKRYFYTKEFSKKFGKFPHNEQQTILRKINLFLDNPYNPLLKTHKLKGRLQDYWSFSLTYSIRILFRFRTSDSVEFIDLGTHEIYK